MGAAVTKRLAGDGFAVVINYVRCSQLNISMFISRG